MEYIRSTFPERGPRSLGGGDVVCWACLGRSKVLFGDGETVGPSSIMRLSTYGHILEYNKYQLSTLMEPRDSHIPTYCCYRDVL